MVLVDFSSILHRMVFASSSEVNPKKVNGKFITSEFAPLMLHKILQELINIDMEHRRKYGDLVLLFDDQGKNYWRKDVYPDYKANRAKGRDDSDINYTEVFEYINPLVELLEDHLPWKCVSVPRAEADDTIMILAREYSKIERILIHSPDKDLIQSQIHGNVDQYSALTKKWLVPENKHDHMEHWVQEHIMLGDASDNVPKVVDHCEFSDNFIQHLKSYGIKELDPVSFKRTNKDNKAKKFEALSTFKIQKTNRKGEETGVLDIFKDVRFGPSTLNKKIREFGSLDNFLDSHPLYREHYERNRILVLEEGIPDYVSKDTMARYSEAITSYNREIVEGYLAEHNLFNIRMELPKVFGHIKEELTIDNCGWD